MGERSSMLIRLDLLEKLKILDIPERWAIVEAAFSYCKTGQEPDFTDRAMKAIWLDMKRMLDFDSERYSSRCERNRENIRKRWNKENTTVYDGIQLYTKHTYTDTKTDTKTDTDLKEKSIKETPDKPPFLLTALNEESHSGKPKRTIFQKPSIGEVKAYCEERKNGIDPESFWNFYDSKGWVIGKSPMRNWHSAIATWEQRSQSTNQSENVGIADVDAAIRKAQGR